MLIWHVYDLTFMCGGRVHVGGVTGETAEHFTETSGQILNIFWTSPAVTAETKTGISI